MKTPSVTAIDSLRARLEERYRATGRWRAVAAEFGDPPIPPGTVHAIARRGYEPKSSTVRKRLGLPELATVTVCPVHGIVHIGRCRKNSDRKPRRPRLSVPADNMERAAEYLRKRLKPEQLVDLIDELMD